MGGSRNLLGIATGREGEVCRREQLEGNEQSARESSGERLRSLLERAQLG